MFPAVISNSTSLSEEASASVSSGNRVQDYGSSIPIVGTISSQQPQKIKKKRNLPGNPDPDAEVIALSPRTLLTTNRFVCEICNKGFQRDQNLQLHRRGHNLPWKLKQRNSEENRKKVYVCPEPSCVHHHPSRALGDLTGIKKHFCRKHWEKKWKCEKCSKFYAVQSDWKAHTKTCGTREYKCHCGVLFNRKDSFITHKAFCDALAQESARLSTNLASTPPTNPTSQPFSLYTQPQNLPSYFIFSNQQQQHHLKTLPDHFTPQNPNPILNQVHHIIKPEQPSLLQKKLITSVTYEDLHIVSSAQLSATALLQKAASVGAHSVGHVKSTMAQFDMGSTVGHVSSNGVPSNYLKFTWKKNDGLTRDFLGLTGEHCGSAGTGHGNGDANGFGSNSNVEDNRKNNMNVRNVPSFTEGLEFPTTTATYERDHSVLKYHQGFGFAEPVAAASETWGNC